MVLVNHIKLYRLWCSYCRVNMPRVYKRTPGSRRYGDYSDEKLNECLTSIRNRSMSTRKAELHFKIPRRTIMNKLKEQHPNKPGRQQIFNTEEESIFARCVFEMSEFGFPVDVFELRCIIHNYLGRTGRQVKYFTDNFPGKEWIRGFLKRNPEVTVRFAANIKKSRAAINEEILTNYINHLQKTLDGVPPQNIWNYDESNLTDDPGCKKVLTKRGVKYPEKVRNASKASISIMMCGSGSGEILPPYVVYRSQNMWSTWTEGGPCGCRYNNSKSGWFTADLFTDWFQTLMLPKLKQLEGKKVIIGDNLSSHITDVVLKACTDNNIYFVCLPANSTHLTQPLDVAFFRPLKAAWKIILASYKESEAGLQSTVLQKQHFPKLLKSLMDAVSGNAANNLKSGFRKCGIIPCDVSVLLERLPGKKCEADQIENSFKEFLNNKRGDIVGNRYVKRRKVNVEAGKSIAHEISIAANEDSQSRNNNRENNQESDNAVHIRNHNKDAPRKEAAVMHKTKGKVKSKLSTISSSEYDTDEDMSIQDSSSGLENFEDCIPPNNDEHKETEDWKPVQKVIGEFVVFRYEGELFPGQIMSFSDKKVTIMSMERGQKSWKWPIKPDIMKYSWMDVLGAINHPKAINKRGFFQIPELDKIWF